MTKQELLDAVAKWMYTYQEVNAKTPEEAEQLEKVFDELEKVVNSEREPVKTKATATGSRRWMPYGYTSSTTTSTIGGIGTIDEILWDVF